jgi:glutamate-1-semialdehyde 2,1-aminomutase
LIFDEVMSGFRASLRGAYGIVGIKPDIATFGKVIGGGLPVGAFGGRREIMKHLSPNGAVYQAGTLSGNPIAMSAGLATVEYLIENEHLYTELEAKAKKLMKGFKKVGKEFGIDIQTAVRGSMFGFFFNSKKVKNYEDAKESDLELFARFHQGMLKEGVYLACSQFETGFISEPITDAMIEYTIEAARTVLEGERN